MRRGALTIGAVLALSAASMANAASPRIVNGVETAEHPAVGALLRTDGGYVVTQHSNRLECTGVLIGCRTFLTAASCVGFPRLPGFAVYLQHAGFLAVSDIRVHPDYDGDSPEHNLAIVELAEPVEGIEPVTLNSTHDLDAIGLGLEGTIVGFGRPGGDHYDWTYEFGIKRTGKVSTASCDQRFDGLGDDAIVCWDFLAPLGDPGEDSNTCDGDQGGPLFLDFSGNLEVAGVVHGETRSDCLSGSQGIAARVDLHTDWIAEQLAGDSADMCGESAEIGTALSPVIEKRGTLGPARPRESLRIPVSDDTNRVLVTFNGSDDEDFDADLYVKKNDDASPADYDCSATGESLFGACDLLDPTEGFLSVLLVARTGYGGSFQLTIVENNEGAPVCGNGKHELGEPCDGEALGECAAGPCSPGCTCPAAVCGNGVLENGESCDDANTVPGDGCDASCAPETPDECGDAPLLELGHGQWSIRGDTTGLGNDYVGCGSKAGDAWYRFSIAEPATLSAQVDAAFDSTLSLYRGDCDGYFYNTCDFDDGPGPASAIAGRNLDAGSYMLIVDGGPDKPEGPFELTLLLAPAGCGNDIVDTSRNEACDGLDRGSCYNRECTPDCECAEPVCGNGTRESYELCDGTDLGICAGGPCGDDCKCPAPICGNDVQEDYDEECDGLDTGWCGDFGIACTDDCKCDYDTCGNDTREGWEECDGTDLGFCDRGPCQGCTCPDPYCGNGDRESGEACDGEDLGSCSYGPCAGDCTCGPAVCGNGKRESPEECDGDQIQSCDIGPCTDECECPAPVCGNDVREDGEGCDGSDDDWCLVGPCSDSCKCPLPVCGNDIRESGEECDGAGDERCLVGSCQNDCTCPDPVCGNGIVETSEQCDAPNLSGCDRGPCTPDCECPPPLCGNEILENEEDCDGSKLGSCPTGPCQGDCTCPDPVCGNGVWESNEDCDGESARYCDSGSCEDDCTCTPTVCGNGIRESAESCDGADQGFCDTGPCQENCTCAPPVCGNNITEGGESCDGTGYRYCVAGPCDPDCTCPAPVCGNDILEQGESCDSTKLGSCLTGPCGEDCKCPEPVCGNNVRESGESCDGTKKGSCLVNPCTPDCTCPAPVCGNYVREPGEQCDGFRLGSCKQGPCLQDCTCSPPVCGDGIWEPPAEECDGEIDWDCDFDGCRQDCMCAGPTCGNDVAEGDEQCDGEDSSCELGCEDDCTCTPYCGDDIVSGDEECDGSGYECASGACNGIDCTCVEPECGDSVVQGDEQCDGNNLGDCPIGPCRSNCRCPKPTCGNGVLESLESCELDQPGVCSDRPCDDQDCTCSVGPICQNAIALPAVLDAYEVDATTVGASNASMGCGGDGGDRWYRFSLERYSVFEASTDGGFDSEVSIFAGPCASLAFVGCDDDGGAGFGSLLGPIALKPGSYVLVIDGHGSDEGEFTLEVDVETWSCCDADESGTVTASDALRVLRKAVGHAQDCPATRCDPSGDREIAASDALIVLRTSVGVAVDLYCPMRP